jgi:hypothetical protein
MGTAFVVESLVLIYLCQTLHTSVVDVGDVVNSVDQAFQKTNCHSADFTTVSDERNENSSVTKSISTTESASQDDDSQFWNL